jgi:succinyl-diaminopimelate desuccinylase
LPTRLTAAGFSVEHLQFGEVSNLWARHGQEGRRLLCFAGHTDVVPPGDLRQDWHSEPFRAGDPRRDALRARQPPT